MELVNFIKKKGIRMKNIKSSFWVFLLFVPLRLAFAATTWNSPPITLSTGNDAILPQVGIDTSGNMVAIWIENNTILSKNNFGSWSVSADDLSANSPQSTHLVVDQNGNATAVWVEDVGGVTSVVTKSRPAGALSSWDASPTTLSTSSPSSNAHIAVNGTGDVVAVWVESTGIMSASKPFGSGWSAAGLISTSGSLWDNPKVSISGDNVVAVWQQVDSGVNTIHAALGVFDTSWDPDTLISDNTHQSNFPEVSYGNGGILAAWFQYDMSGTDFIDVSVDLSFSDGATWTTPSIINYPGDIDTSKLELQVASSSGGSGVVVNTFTSGSGDFGLQSTSESDISSNEGNTKLTIYSGNEGQMSFNLAFNPIRGAFVDYMVAGESILDVYAVSAGMDSLDSWEPATMLSVMATFNGYPVMAASNNSTDHLVVAAWVSYNGSVNEVQVITGTNPILDPPTGLTVSQITNDYMVSKSVNGDTYVRYDNVVGWTLNPLATAYVIYRAGKKIAMIDGSQSSYTDSNRPQGESVQYGVAAVADSFQSNTATVQLN
jgi:hypothetical protein